MTVEQLWNEGFDDGLKGRVPIDAFGPYYQGYQAGQDRRIIDERKKEAMVYDWLCSISLKLTKGEENKT